MLVDEAKTLIHMSVSAIIASVFLALAVGTIGIGYILWGYFSRQENAASAMSSYVNFTAYDNSTVRGQEVVQLIEANEDIFDAMIREVKEELLINLTREDIKIIHLMHHYTGERLNFIFEADGTNLKPEIGEKNKCSELRWAAMESLPSETTAKVKLIINNILENKFYDKL